MGFSNVSKVRAIPTDATATYTFHDIMLPGAVAPVEITLRHAGEGTPGFNRAEWALAERARAKRKGWPETLSESATRERIAAMLELIARHCVVSWANVIEDDGAVSACKESNVVDFLAAVLKEPGGIEAIHAFIAFARDAANFRPVLDIDASALGKA